MVFGPAPAGPEHRVGKEEDRDETGRPISTSIRVHTGPRKALQVK